MYTPAHFVITDLSRMHAIMEQSSFAVLTVISGASIEATHLPVLLDRSRGEFGTLLAHVARANPIWKAFDGREALTIFQGAHAYVSPSWYPPDERSVPTWDYLAVHAYGRPCLLEDNGEVLALLTRTVEAYEGPLEAPWRLEAQDRDWIERLSAGVAAFEIEIERIEGKAKVGQNHPSWQVGVANALEGSGRSDLRELAGEVRRANGLPANDGRG